MNDPIATSDELPELAQLLDVLKQLWSTLGSVLRVRAVIDSNAVIADLRYLATKRRNPKMRTYLQEVLAAGTLIGYAPDVLGVEVESHFDELAEQTGRPREVFVAEWASYKKLIKFVPVEVPKDALAESAKRSLRDPSDLPFVLVYEAVAAQVIYTRDADHRPTNARTASRLEVLLTLRAYSRAAAVEVKIFLTGAGVMTLALSTLAVLATGLKLLGSLFMKAPTWVKVLLVGVALLPLLPLLHGPTRARLAAWVQHAKKTLGTWWDEAQPQIARWAKDYHEQSQAAFKAKSELEASLSTTEKLPLRVLVFRAVVEAQAPLTPPGVADAVKAMGYRSRAKSFEQYVRRALRRDQRLREEQGRWLLASH